MTEGDLPLLDRISDYVAWYAMRTPDAEALVLGARRICYRELAREIDANARALLAAGVRPGDRVATLLPPHPDFFVQFLATASIGAIWVGLNPRYQRDELAFVLNDCRPVVVFLRARIGARDYTEDLAALRAAHAATRWVTLGDTGSLEGCTPVTEFLSEGAAVREETLAQAREAVRTGDPAGHHLYLRQHRTAEGGAPAAPRTRPLLPRAVSPLGDTAVAYLELLSDQSYRLSRRYYLLRARRRRLHRVPGAV